MEQTLHNAFKRFSLGDELRAYTFLGCHAAERDGVHGYVFRVWAPRAQGVTTLYASDSPGDFAALAGQFLDRPIEKDAVGLVDIERY